MPRAGDKVYLYNPRRMPEYTGGNLASYIIRLMAFLGEEFRNVANGLQGVYQLPVMTAEPQHLREGLMVYADGTTWNPGSGVGVYVYKGAATGWVKLG